MKKIIAAGLLAAVALVSAASAQAQPDLRWACQRLNAQPNLVGVTNVVATLSMNSQMTAPRMRDALLLGCPRHRYIIENYFGIG